MRGHSEGADLLLEALLLLRALALQLRAPLLSDLALHCRLQARALLHQPLLDAPLYVVAGQGRLQLVLDLRAHPHTALSRRRPRVPKLALLSCEEALQLCVGAARHRCTKRLCAPRTSKADKLAHSRLMESRPCVSGRLCSTSPYAISDAPAYLVLRGICAALGGWCQWRAASLPDARCVSNREPPHSV